MNIFKDQFKNILLILFSFVFVLISTQNTLAEKYFLINPSVQCQAYIETYFKNILETKDGLFAINANENTTIKISNNNYSEYDYHLTFKADNSSMIISKPNSNQTGTLTIFNKINPCRSIITKDFKYASSFISNLKQQNVVDENKVVQNNIVDTDNVSETDNISANQNNISELVVERELLFNELVKQSELLLLDIKNYIKKPNNLDAIKLGKLFLEFNSLDNENFNQDYIDKYNKLLEYVNQDDEFVSYRSLMISNRKNENRKILEDNIKFLEHARQQIQNFVVSNLDSENIEEAINLATKIDQSLNEENSKPYCFKARINNMDEK